VSPEEQSALAATWLDWFDAQRVEAVGLGLVTLRAAGHADPVVRVEELRQAVEQPFGAHVGAWLDRQDWLRAHPDGALLTARLRTAEGLRLRQEASQGADGWQVDRQLLELPGGPRWVEEIDPVVLALVSGCDGCAALGDQLSLLAAAHEVELATLTEVAVPIVAHLVERGILLPATAEQTAAERAGGG
jgi:hypothetical protein